MNEAHRDAACDGHVVARRPLLYARGEDRALDRPPHVRSGSALGRLASGAIVVVQDDAAFLAVTDTVGGAVHDVPLPDADGVRLFDDVRGNKELKLDLEACIVAPGDVLVAFGSGSAPLRDRVVLAHFADVQTPHVRVVRAQELYRRLGDPAFAGSSLNLEGAATDGHDVVFFQRGNGAPGGDLEPRDATCRVELAALLAYLEGRGPCPPLRDVTSWSLGTAGGVRVTFTDGATTPDGRIAFLACAEASPDATRDGPVSGAFIGLLDERAGTARLGLLHDEHGAPLLDKCEGLLVDLVDPQRAFVVVDKDDPARASDLLEVRLGPAFRV